MCKKTFLIFVGMLTVSALTSCTTLTSDQYEATALTTYIWQVKYADGLANDKIPRLETFAETSLLNRNGLKPEGAVTGPDDKGLWWPALPPRPTINEVEQRERPQEEASKPELLRNVECWLKYKVGKEEKTLPTNYQVYWQVVKAYQSHTPLHLTLGVGDNSVEKAEPVFE